MLDSDQLYQILPKEIHEWDEQDVGKWLKASMLSSADITMSGIELLAANPASLVAAGIQSNFIIRKIITWLEQDAHQFNTFVQQMRSEQPQICTDSKLHHRISNQNQGIHMPTKALKIEKEGHIGNEEISHGNEPISNRNQITSNIPLEDQYDSHKYKAAKKADSKLHQDQSRKDILPRKIDSMQKKGSNENSQLQLNALAECKFIESHIVPQENSLLLQYKDIQFKVAANTKIGRNKTNDLILHDDWISRQHLEIKKIQNQYFLQDMKSRYGTYVKQDSMLTASTKDSYKLGEDIFRILSVKVTKGTFNLEASISDDQASEEKTHSFEGRKSVTIGRGAKDIVLTESNEESFEARLAISKGKVMFQCLQGDLYLKLVPLTFFRVDNNLTLKLASEKATLTKLNIGLKEESLDDYRPFNES